MGQRAPIFLNISLLAASPGASRGWGSPHVVPLSSGCGTGVGPKNVVEVAGGVGLAYARQQ